MYTDVNISVFATEIPDSIMLTIPGNSVTSRAFTWRTAFDDTLMD